MQIIVYDINMLVRKIRVFIFRFKDNSLNSATAPLFLNKRAPGLSKAVLLDNGHQ